VALGDAGGVARERWALLGKLRDAGWRLSLALCLIALVTALIPAASAVTMALLVGSLERRLAFAPGDEAGQQVRRVGAPGDPTSCRRPWR